MSYVLMDTMLPGLESAVRWFENRLGISKQVQVIITRRICPTNL